MIVMSKEDKWEKLYEKYMGMPERTKTPVPAKKVLTIAGLAVACVSILFLFYFFNYFALPMYDNVNAAVMSMVTSDGSVKLGLSGLPAERCYWIRPTYDGRYLLEVKVYESRNYSQKCIGTPINTTVLTLDYPIDIAGDTDCVCGENRYWLDKMFENDRLQIKITS